MAIVRANARGGRVVSFVVWIGAIVYYKVAKIDEKYAAEMEPVPDPRADSSAG